MVEEQKPYWPGLEIDGQQEGKLRSDGKSVTEETNTAAISVEEEQKLPPTDDSRNINKKRCLGAIPPTFRSRKRKQKTNNNNNNTNTKITSQPISDLVTTVENTKSGSTTRDTSAAAGAELGIINEITKNQEQNTNEPSADNNITTKPIAASASVVPISSEHTLGENDNMDDQSSVSTERTPGTLVKFLLRKKLPILEEVVTNIRNVLLGMLTGSPALIQRDLITPTSSLSPHSGDGTSNNGESKIESINGNGHEKNVKNSNELGKEQSPEEVIAKLEIIGKRHEALLNRLESAAAKREEELRNDVQDQKLTQDLQLHQQEEQHESAAKLLRDYHSLKEENTSLKLELEQRERSNDMYQVELQRQKESIKALEESKRSIHFMFQSRITEQFRELTERECDIKKKKELLTNAYLEIEKLRNRIVELEQEKRWGTNVETTKSRAGVNEIIDSSAAHLGTNLTLPRSGKGQQLAFSHRVRHRQNKY